MAVEKMDDETCWCGVPLDCHDLADRFDPVPHQPDPVPVLVTLDGAA